MKERHIRLELAQDSALPASNAAMRAVGWDLAGRAAALMLTRGSLIDVAYRIRENDHPEYDSAKKTPDACRPTTERGPAWLRTDCLVECYCFSLPSGLGLAAGLGAGGALDTVLGLAGGGVERGAGVTAGRDSRVVASGLLVLDAAGI